MMEAIALAELEESKAGERVREIKYQLARFNADAMRQAINAEIARQPHLGPGGQTTEPGRAGNASGGVSDFGKALKDPTKGGEGAK